MINDAVIAIHTRYSLHLCDETSIAILELTCSRHQLYTFKINSAFIPSLTFLIQFKYSRCCRTFLRMNLSHWTQGTLLLEVNHRGSLGLDDNKVNTRTYFVSFGVKHITGGIITYVGLKNWIHANLLYSLQEINGFINSLYKCLTVKIP